MSLAWGRVGISIFIAIGLALLVILCLITLNKPRTFAVIDGRTEIMEFRVFNPELSIIYGSGFKISSWPGKNSEVENKCISGAILPGVMASVTYQRIADDRLLITINGKGEWRSESDVKSFNGELVLYSDSSDPIDKEETCGSTSTRLPIWGPGRIGAPLAMRSDGPGPILLEGEVLTYGTTTGLLSAKGGGALYQAGEPIALPSGSYLDSNGASDRNDGAVPVEQTALFGYISLSNEPGLGVVVSTDTPYLQLTKPGARENSSRIEVGLFAQIVNDPSIFILQFFAVLIGLFWPIGIDLVSLATSKNEKPDDTDQETLKRPEPEGGAMKVVPQGETV